MSVKDIGLSQTAWITHAQQKTPSVPAPEKTAKGGKHPGSENPSREASDYSEGKKTDTILYGPDGETHDLDRDSYPTLDEMG